MSSDSWQLAGMADRGMLPTVLGQRYYGFLVIFSQWYRSTLSCRSKFETPTYGILISATGIVCLCWMTFDQVTYKQLFIHTYIV